MKNQVPKASSPVVTRAPASRPLAPAQKRDETATAHLKLVPPTRELRAMIRNAAARVAERLDRSHPPTHETLRSHAETLLRELDLPAGYLGFAMVTVSNEFWREQFMAVDFNRRLLLLPRCLKCVHSKPPAANGPGPNCKECGSCNVADFKVSADELGYRVLMAEGTPTVLKIITTERVDAILGVACLNVLERAFDKVRAVGVPALAVPLLSNSCLDSSVDADWVAEVVRLRTRRPVQHTRSYLPLLRLANEICSGAMLDALAPRMRLAAAPVETIVPVGDGNDRDSRQAKLKRVAAAPDPIAATEQTWLRLAGQRRQTVPAVHHAGGLRRDAGGPRHAVGRRGRAAAVA
ncbi:MAG: DUF116 domain-containing protein [Verrucomicrobiae bacterium]|nr:DUF116 domain-containing protein [Verrucomicrobiae bacterium]